MRIKYEENYITTHDILKKRIVVYIPNGKAVYLDITKDELNFTELMGLLETFKLQIMLDASR